MIETRVFSFIAAAEFELGDIIQSRYVQSDAVSPCLIGRFETVPVSGFQNGTLW